MSYVEVGYHGTSKEYADNIKDNAFEVSEGDRYWLGNGAYLFGESFGNAIERARDWCLGDIEKGKYTNYGILQAEVYAREQEVLDLEQPEHSDLVHGHRDILVARLNNSSMSIEVSNPRHLDGKAINELCSLFPYKVVCGKFYTKKVRMEVDPNSRFPNCKIIAVREVTNHVRNVGLVEKG